jgi:hypothetical protein
MPEASKPQAPAGILPVHQVSFVTSLRPRPLLGIHKDYSRPVKNAFLKE